MKFNCPDIDAILESRRLARIEKVKSWRRTFALFPVRVEDGTCRWMEFVEKRRFTRYSDDNILGFFNFLLGMYGNEYRAQEPTP